MANFWLNTEKTSLLGRNRKSITIPAFAVRAGEDNKSLYFKLRDSSGSIYNGLTSDVYSLKSAFTIEMWLKTWGTFETGAILFANHRVSEDDNSIEILLQDQKIGIALLKGGVTYTLVSAIPFPVSRWFHLAISYDGTTVKIFVDGVQDSNTLTLAANLSTALGDEYEYHLGNNQSGGSAFPYVGYMAEIKVWNVCLTRERISRNRFFRRGKNAGLIQYFKTNVNVTTERTILELIENKTILLDTYATSSQLEKVSNEYPPLKYGASFIAAKLAVTVTSPITIKYPVSLPSEANFMLCVSYVGDDNRMVRYKLWDMEGVTLYPKPERYRGQPLPLNFFFEIWNIDGNEDCTLEEDLILLASKTNIPSTQIDQSNQDMGGTLVIDYTLFEILPTTFPADFADSGFGTVASPVTQPVGTYSTNLTVYGGI